MWEIHNEDCLHRMRLMETNSVDAIVTDPPYELGFMGKKWDSTGIAFNVEVWQESLRILKPGGHILAFGGSRTWHRLAVAIEDAGFEIRDSIAWLYGSGFPKSMDISAAIDKGSGQNRERQLQFTKWMRSTGVTAEQINTATGSNMASHYLTTASQPAIATADMFDLMRPLLPKVPEYIERLVAERTGIEWTAYKARPITGHHEKVAAAQQWSENYDQKGRDLSAKERRDIASTPEAAKWQGWGTALKPAFEPIVVGRKPLIGTVAANVLTYGTGGLNIEATRIGEEKRWTPNLMLDEFTAEILDKQVRGTEASRFFYVAKASQADRSEGLENSRNIHPTVKPTEIMQHLIRLVTPAGGTVFDPFTGSGSTGKAALLEGFNFIGTELNPEYIPIINARLAHAEETAKEQLL